VRRPEVRAQPDGSLRAVARCILCGREYESDKTLTKEQLEMIESGTYVQDVLPDWTPAERELFFISGTCDACWRDLYGEEEE
jgi:hypothetical protein